VFSIQAAKVESELANGNTCCRWKLCLVSLSGGRITWAVTSRLVSVPMLQLAACNCMPSGVAVRHIRLSPVSSLTHVSYYTCHMSTAAHFCRMHVLTQQVGSATGHFRVTSAYVQVDRLCDSHICVHVLVE